MSLAWEALTVDASAPPALAAWWAETLGWEVVTHEPYGVEARPPDGRGPSLFFIAVTEQKTANEGNESACCDRGSPRGTSREPIAVVGR